MFFARGFAPPDGAAAFAERALMARLIQSAGFLGPLFRPAHGAEVQVKKGHGQGTKHGQDTVKIQGDRLEQHRDRLFFGNAAGGEITDERSQPAAERKQHAPGCGRCMDNKGRLLMGHLQGIVKGTGHGACDHTAERAGGENDESPAAR